MYAKPLKSSIKYKMIFIHPCRHLYSASSSGTTQALWYKHNQRMAIHLDHKIAIAKVQQGHQWFHYFSHISLHTSQTIWAVFL